MGSLQRGNRHLLDLNGAAGCQETRVARHECPDAPHSRPGDFFVISPSSNSKALDSDGRSLSSAMAPQPVYLQGRSSDLHDHTASAGKPDEAMQRHALGSLEQCEDCQRPCFCGAGCALRTSAKAGQACAHIGRRWRRGPLCHLAGQSLLQVRPMRANLVTNLCRLDHN